MNHIWGSLLGSQCTLEWLGQVYQRMVASKGCNSKSENSFCAVFLKERASQKTVSHYATRNMAESKMPQEHPWIQTRSSTFFCDGKGPLYLRSLHLCERKTRKLMHCSEEKSINYMPHDVLLEGANKTTERPKMKCVTTHTFLALCGTGISKSSRCECLYSKNRLMSFYCI